MDGQSTTANKRHFRAIWISDLHLGTKGCQAEALAAFLKQHSCDQLFLVGDIIDAWRMRKKAYWPQSHVNVIRRILTLAKRGTHITYVIGNHDEFLRKYEAAAYGNIELVDEAIYQTEDGRKLLITHGDKFDAVVRCHKWLAYLGDVGYESLLVINRWFNQARRWLGLDYWSLSKFVKHRVKRAVSFITDFEQVLAHECQRRQLDGIVCGHIHHPEIRKIGPIDYYNCGDWVESCSALVEQQDGHIKLIHWLDVQKQQQLNQQHQPQSSPAPRSKTKWRKAG